MTGERPARPSRHGEGPHAPLDANALAAEVADALRHAASAEGRHRSLEWSEDAACTPQVVADLREVIVARLGDAPTLEARGVALTAAKRAAGTVVSSLSGAFRTQLEREAA